MQYPPYPPRYSPYCPPPIPPAPIPPQESLLPPEVRLQAAKKCYNRTGFALYALLLVHALLPSLLVFLLMLSGIAVTGTVSYAISAFSFSGVGIPLFFLIMKKEPPATPGKHSISALHFFEAFLICLPLLYLGNFLGIFINEFLSHFQTAPATTVEETTSALGIGLTFLFVVLLAPLSEEFVFRRLLLDRVGKYGNAPAIALSGLSFGFFHGNFLQFFYAMFLGFFFAFLYLRTGKLRYTVFLHMLINFFGSIVPMLLSAMAGLDKLPAGAEGEIPLDALFLFMLYGLLVLGLVISGIVLFILGRRKFTLPPRPGELEGKKEGMLLFSPGILIFFIFCALFFLLFLL